MQAVSLQEVPGRGHEAGDGGRLPADQEGGGGDGRGQSSKAGGVSK